MMETTMLALALILVSVGIVMYQQNRGNEEIRVTRELIESHLEQFGLEKAFDLATDLTEQYPLEEPLWWHVDRSENGVMVRIGSRRYIVISVNIPTAVFTVLALKETGEVEVRDDPNLYGDQLYLLLTKLIKSRVQK